MKMQRTTEDIPPHLCRYLIQQDPSLYTPIDQACWRFILKLSQAFFEKNAHQIYLNGLSETGISVEKIPLIEEMDECLRKFNWRAVSVSGFIPPAAFMEFLSLGILPIACDMRKLEHIAYTPAPDIVHEAAGHAPIIADPEYSEYLRSYGEISKKAISSIEDLHVYEAIRHLSEMKEDPNSTPDDITRAQEALNLAIHSVTYTSEATLLARMGWWTFEYGLIEGTSQSQIYGAGLLSSLSEGFHFLDQNVKKIPFSIDCTELAYDITRPQPQLFVAPDFHTLRKALIELENQMAFRKGGIESLEKALRCKTVTTTVMDSGAQISGILKKIRRNQIGEPIYLNFDGPTQISFEDQEIPGQGVEYHRSGFGTPLVEITETLLQRWQNHQGIHSSVQLSSGVRIEGIFLKSIQYRGQTVLISFQNCTVSYDGEILFHPDWGTYDMICGKKVVSVFGGPADRENFKTPQSSSISSTPRQKSNLTPSNEPLSRLYQEVRMIRERPRLLESDAFRLKNIHLELEERYPTDWLLRFELLEILVTHQIQPEWGAALKNTLKDISHHSPEKAELIQRGVSLLKSSL